MPVVPEGPWSMAAFGVILVGSLFVFRRGMPKAYGLGVVLLAVFAVDFLAAVVGRTSVQFTLGFQTDTLLAGKWWSPYTSMFVHRDLLHLVGNLFILLTAGPALEDRIGERRFLLVYFTAGFGAVLAHIALSYVVPDIVPPQVTALGASGAIFGILTAFAVRHPRTQLPVFLGFFLVFMPSFIVLLIYLGFNLVYMFGSVAGSATSIAWWGHFGGFLVGLPWAYTLPKGDPRAPPRGGEGLPDPEKLEVLATTRETRELLGRVRQFDPEARTEHDAEFALAWVDRLLEKAACPTCGAAFTREGLTARCASGETVVDFRLKPKK